MTHHFSTTYREARSRFRQRAADRGARLEAHPVAPGSDLTIDVAGLGPTHPRRLLIVSSGLHGGEGFFGSAVQLAWLERWQPSDVGVLLWHALNPFGFDQLRRANENNVDLNRNFHLPGQPFTGSPAGYAALDPLINPPGPPTPDLFAARLWWQAFRQGPAKLGAAIASGQHDFPRGLFYGGTGPEPTQRILAGHLPRWVGSAERVVHVDYHTGLGAFGTHTLLASRPEDSPYVKRLRAWFGETAVTASGASAYPTLGAIDDWLEHTLADRDCVSVCAEFGTYGPVNVLTALRNENRAHFYGRPDDPRLERAKAAMRETFGPASPQWRERVVTDALAVLGRAEQSLVTK